MIASFRSRSLGRWLIHSGSRLQKVVVAALSRRESCVAWKKTAPPKTEIQLIPVLRMSSRFLGLTVFRLAFPHLARLEQLHCETPLGPAFVSLTRLHFALYSCRVAAFATPAASICTVTPKRSFLATAANRVNCPLELVRDSVWGGRIRLPLEGDRKAVTCLTRNSSLALPIGAVPQQGVRKEVSRTRWLACAQFYFRRSS
jgi:hypothetical protein